MNDTSLANTTSGPAGYQPKYPQLVEFSKEYANIHGPIAVVVCAWGVIANLVNIVVLTRKNMQSSTNLILTWLAVADLLTMASYLPVSIHFYIMRDPQLEFPSTRSIGWIGLMLFHINFTVVCHTIAIWLTIILAIFRYLYICYPIQGASLCSMLRAKIAILCVYLCTAVVCIPNYLLNAVKHDTSRCTNNVTTPACSHYEFKNSKLAEPFLNNFNYWIQAGLIKLIPCALLTILTILLIFAMHAANKRRMALKSQGKKDESDRAREHNRTTAMLLAIVALFLLTELPQGVLTLCSIFIETFFDDVYWPLGDLLDIMALLNNSINFVLYCTMSRQFRDTFKNVFCSCCESRPGWMKVRTAEPNGGGTSKV
ncbi:hypothetical protein CAPTEDRAFT_142791 [Capitella teleta]|uniref:G-protein coupled receptors family 1 profile domain-containing protein n=1 Tax=Capitella teleta TaxID=283909 RepID=R7TZX6_CAPTE|nr:hypothetical protein CAPTEDRAFT_142791 [Capitella teleta]|eukprot:ELT99172.1 hypothetical protein CAPTEDRAFT_142791 [Capitella teleta]